MSAPRKYPQEVRDRAVRLVFETREQTGQRAGAVARIADQLGINRETLRNWVAQAEIDGGQRPGVPTAERQRIAELERESGPGRPHQHLLRPPAPATVGPRPAR